MLSGFRAIGIVEFMVGDHGSEFRVKDVGFGVWGSLRSRGVGFRLQGIESCYSLPQTRKKASDEVEFLQQ